MKWPSQVRLMLYLQFWSFHFSFGGSEWWCQWFCKIFNKQFLPLATRPPHVHIEILHQPVLAQWSKWCYKESVGSWRRQTNANIFSGQVALDRCLPQKSLLVEVIVASTDSPTVGGKQRHPFPLLTLFIKYKYKKYKYNNKHKYKYRSRSDLRLSCLMQITQDVLTNILQIQNNTGLTCQAAHYFNAAVHVSVFMWL